MVKRGFLERQGYKKKVVINGLIIIFIILILSVGYYFFLYSKNCTSESCYNDAIKGCNRVNYIKEDGTASWLYEINGGKDQDTCEVSVTLLNLKEGDIDIEKLQGKSMTCNVNKLNPSDPEKNIADCTGELKEELQEMIIQRMHSYVLENLEEVIPEIEKILKGGV